MKQGDQSYKNPLQLPIFNLGVGKRQAGRPVLDSLAGKENGIGNCMGEGADFDRRLLAALRDLAVRSPRAQADVQAALFKAGIAAAPEVISGSLSRLVDQALIRNTIRLHDGGILVTVALAIN